MKSKTILLSFYCFLFLGCKGQLSTKDRIVIYPDSKAIWLSRLDKHRILKISGIELKQDSLTRFENHAPLIIDGKSITSIHASKKLLNDVRFVLPDEKLGYNGSLIIEDRSFVLPDTLFYHTDSSFDNFGFVVRDKKTNSYLLSEELGKKFGERGFKELEFFVKELWPEIDLYYFSFKIQTTKPVN